MNSAYQNANMLSEMNMKDRSQQNDDSVNKASPFLKATPKPKAVLRTGNNSISAGVKSRARTKALASGINNVTMFVKDNEEMKEV